MNCNPYTSENRQDTALHDAQQCLAIFEIVTYTGQRIRASSEIAYRDWGSDGDGDRDEDGDGTKCIGGGGDSGGDYATLGEGQAHQEQQI